MRSPRVKLAFKHFIVNYKLHINKIKDSDWKIVE